jgi:hypothetical protein
VVARVTRGVREKVAQNVAQPVFCQNRNITFTVESILTTSVIFKQLSKVDIHPLGENSPTLVNLVVAYFLSSQNTRSDNSLRHF